MTELFKQAPTTLLKEHYRCHPKIIGFCNRKFYNNELIILSDVKTNKNPLVLCYTTEGNHERNHYNQRQIDIITNEIIPKYKLNIEDNNLEIFDSKLHSIFDYLYKSYEKRKLEILSKQKRISQYDSENLTYALIKDVLKQYYKNQFSVTPQVPLKSILRDKSLLNPGREKEYALNDLTRIDFVIYKTIDNSPFLAIEVDGYKYHQEGTQQAQRDILKNDILNKYNIPLIRFKTNGSDEKNILISTINKIMN